MLDSQRRRKMISLRLSEAEYQALKAQAASHGSRCVSDVARLAIQEFLCGSPADEDELKVKIRELDVRLNRLESRLSLLAFEPADGVR